MNAYVIAAKLFCFLLSFLFATSAFSQAGTTPAATAREEIRQVCSSELEQSARTSENGITQNTLGIIPTINDYDRLSSSRARILANTVNGEISKISGIASLCIYSVRMYQLKRGGGDQAGAREDFMSLRNPLEQRLNAIAAAKGGNVGAVDSANSVSGGALMSTCARSPDATLAQFNADLQEFMSRNPNPVPPGQAGAGSRAQYQWSLFVGTEGLKMLEPLRNCLGPHYSPNKSALESMRDRGLEGCRRLSTDPSSCVPRYPS